MNEAGVSPQGVGLMIMMASVCLAISWWLFCEILEFAAEAEKAPIPQEVTDEIHLAERRLLAAEGLAKVQYERKVAAILRHYGRGE